MSTLAEQALVTPITDLMQPGRIRRHLEELKHPVDAIATPFDSWNDECRDAGGGVGLAMGWHVILAGSTGHGKSLMALNIAAEAIKAGEVVAFMSLEMSTAQLASRLYAILTDTDVRLLERGHTAPPEVERKLCEIHEETGGRFLTNEQPVHEISRIQAQIRYWVEEKGARLCIVDYLQLATSRTGRNALQRGERHLVECARVGEAAECRDGRVVPNESADIRRWFGISGCTGTDWLLVA